MWGRFFKVASEILNFVCVRWAPLHLLILPVSDCDGSKDHHRIYLYLIMYFRVDKYRSITGSPTAPQSCMNHQPPCRDPVHRNWTIPQYGRGHQRFNKDRHAIKGTNSHTLDYSHPHDIIRGSLQSSSLMGFRHPPIRRMVPNTQKLLSALPTNSRCSSVSRCRSSSGSLTGSNW